MLNIPLLTAAIAAAPNRFIKGNWRSKDGGECVVAWLCSFFHTQNPSAPHHEVYANEIEPCVVRAYGIPLDRVEYLVTLNDHTEGDDDRRRVVLAQLSEIIEHERSKQAFRTESAAAELQLPLSPSAPTNGLPIDIVAVANSIIEAQLDSPTEMTTVRELVGTS